MYTVVLQPVILWNDTQRQSKYPQQNETVTMGPSHHPCQKMLHFLHTTILTMCTAKKVNLNLEAKAPLRCRLS
jgi:hypothetical protein